MAEEEIWAKLREIQSFLDDLNSRLVTLEAWVGKAFFIPSFPTASRWVLELFPDEIEKWREVLARIPRERLTERERSFLSNLDYYIMTERKITIPQLSWLGAIVKRIGYEMPPIPIPSSSPQSHHSSNPQSQLFVCEQCGTPFSTPQEACPVCYGKVVIME
jgi:hypothetical protein